MHSTTSLGRRLRLPRLVLVALLLLAPIASGANNHLVRIEQVLAGANGDSRVQFVEIKLGSPDQNTWGPQPGESASRAMLTFHDATGAQVGRSSSRAIPPWVPPTRRTAASRC